MTLGAPADGRAMEAIRPAISPTKAQKAAICQKEWRLRRDRAVRRCWGPERETEGKGRWAARRARERITVWAWGKGRDEPKLEALGADLGSVDSRPLGAYRNVVGDVARGCPGGAIADVPWGITAKANRRRGLETWAKTSRDEGESRISHERDLGGSGGSLECSNCF
ncbi:MAG: hypothetical protein Fur0042_14970 [Cyanophyceae cyanobacterium]